MIGKVEKHILSKLKGSKLHFTLLDPDSISLDRASVVVRQAQEAGTDGIMIGGSTNASGAGLDALVKTIKATTDLPVILFPGGPSAISPYADAIFFMSILNSRNPYFITKSQALGALPVKMAKIEPIPMAYLVVEPGMTVGFIGEADLLPRNKPDITVAYALAGQYLGMRMVYLEAGSGADETVPPEIVKKTKSIIDVPLIVGGGIRSPKKAKELADAGADIIVTGTLTEKDTSQLIAVIRAVKG